MRKITDGLQHYNPFRLAFQSAAQVGATDRERLGTGSP